MTAVTGLRCVWAGSHSPLSAIPLITLPQLFLLKITPKITRLAFIYNLSKINIAIWEVISHLWFLLTLALLTGICFTGSRKSRITLPQTRSL